MKTLKLFFTALGLCATLSTVKAATPPTAPVMSKEYAINAYVDAMCHGKLTTLNNVLDQNAKFSMVRGKSVISSDKADMLSFLKANQNIDQNCAATVSVVDSNEDVTVVKVDMQYQNFVRSNYVTIANTGNGWKITNVHSVFKS